MHPEDLLEIDLDGNPVRGGTPSSEIKLHLVCYQERNDCNAVVHAHPATAVGLELAGIPIPDNVLPESAIVLGSIAVSPFGMPRTQEVPEGIRPLLANHKTIVMSHHGAVTLGDSLWDAWARMEILEKVAKIIWVAHTVGAPEPMPKEAFQQLLETSLNAELSY